MKVPNELVITDRPKGVSNAERRAVNEYRVGDTLDEVKHNILNARALLNRRNMESALLKNTIIMNFGRAYQERNNPEWFDEHYTYDDFLKECHISEKTARDYEKYYTGLQFYRSQGVEIIQHNIKNIRELTRASMVDYVRENPVILERPIFHDPKTTFKEIRAFKEENAIIDESFSTRDGRRVLFTYSRDRNTITLKLLSPAYENEVIDMLNEYGEEE